MDSMLWNLEKGLVEQQSSSWFVGHIHQLDGLFREGNMLKQRQFRKENGLLKKSVVDFWVVIVCVEGREIPN